MSSFNVPHALVMALLPDRSADAVLTTIAERDGTTALTWKARGTLLREHWLARWMPPIGPGNTVLQMVVPATAADSAMAMVADVARLHQQATGAVFSVPVTHTHIGSQFHRWPQEALAGASLSAPVLSDDLHLVCSIVGSTRSERIARAAVDAGAHGPVVYFSEGRGLRDRIGWLRITKDHQQEMQMVVVDSSRVDGVIDTIARDGKFHLPGRGLLYSMPLGKGVVNLPSRFARAGDAASLQQIVRAIDHLAGHREWREQTSVASNERGISTAPGATTDADADHVALTAVVRSEHVDRVTDLILDGGARGLNRVEGRFVGAEDLNPDMSARVQHGYVVLRSIVTADVAKYVCEVVDQSAETLGVRDMCLLTHPVARFLRYIPGGAENRVRRQAVGA